VVEESVTQNDARGFMVARGHADVAEELFALFLNPLLMTRYARASLRQMRVGSVWYLYIAQRKGPCFGPVMENMHDKVSL
jgi:hypothetical protein